MDKDLNNYYTKGRISGSKYNFSLEPLIKDFSFYDFCRSAHTPDHGGFVVITDKQYIVGYNAGFGEGAHVYAFARCMKDMYGGGLIESQVDAIKLAGQLERKYLYARIVYETEEEDFSHQKYQSGYIVFPLTDYMGNKNITEEQYSQFLKFYEKYNEEIEYVCKKFNFVVSFTTRDSEGKIEHNYSNNLDNLLNYLKGHLIETNDVDNEVILEHGKSK